MDRAIIARHLHLASSGAMAERLVNAPIIGFMVRTHLFFKVEIEHGEDESPERIGEEIARHLRKLYVVRSVELSSVVTEPE
jgi:hypothetical protein